MPSVLCSGSITPFLNLELIVGGSANLLSANQASIEQDASGWGAATNCSVAQTTAQAQNGIHSLQMTSTAAGDMTANNGVAFPSTYAPVTPGLAYTAMCSTRAVASARSTQLTLVFVDGLGVTTGSSVSVVTANNTSAWTQVIAAMIAPVRSAYAYISIAIQATGAGGEVHYVDEAGIYQGTNSVWSYTGQPLAVTPNLLTVDQSSFEASVAGWFFPVGSSAASVAQSTAQAWQGGHSMAVTCNGTGGTSAVCVWPGSTQGPQFAIAISPSTIYTASAYLRAATTGRTTQIYINWYDATGVSITNSTVVNGTDITAGWTQVSVTATSPSNAYFATVVVQTLSNAGNEVHYIDGAMFCAGSSTAWVAGGLLGSMVLSAAANLVLWVGCGALSTGEVAFIRAYTGIGLTLAYFGSFVAGSDVDSSVYTVPIPVTDQIYFTVQQKNGTAKALPWKVYAL